MEMHARQREILCAHSFIQQPQLEDVTMRTNWFLASGKLDSAAD
jgi:hypothetical protein